MAIEASSSAPVSPGAGALVYRGVYRAVAYLGLMSIMGTELYGFRTRGTAPWSNAVSDLLIYGIFIVPHLIMTRAWFKKAVWGTPAGSPRERQVYIVLTLVTWFGVIALHRPLPGTELAVPQLVRYAGTMAFLVCFLLFFQGISFAMIDGLLGVPGSTGGYTHGGETPLFTEGPYASVRHPMYRAIVLAGLASLLVHPSLTQLFWVALITGSFIGFIPVEEAQLIRARGDDYRNYMERTPYRLFRGIW